jgi:hypothetical protein
VLVITIVAGDAPTHFAVVSVVVAAVTSILMYITEKQERCAFKFLLAAVHCQIDAERALEKKHKAEAQGQCTAICLSPHHVCVAAFYAVNLCAQQVTAKSAALCDGFTQEVHGSRGASITAFTDDASSARSMLARMKKMNDYAHARCREIQALKQMALGTYLCEQKVVDIRSLAGKWGAGHKLSVTIGGGVPVWVSVPIVPLSIIMSNAIHNAKMHGKRGGKCELHVAVHQEKLILSLKNEAGDNHQQALNHQSHHGDNAIFNEDGYMPLGTVAHSSSNTLPLGIREMRTAGVAMNAALQLMQQFYPAKLISSTTPTV